MTLIERLQPLGRALMLPIAVLPVAGLLLRIGQPDLLDIAFVSAAGSAIFTHLGLLFAIGVATGFARDGNGAAALAGVTCFLIAREGAAVLIAVPPDVTVGLAADAVAAAEAAWRSAQMGKLEVPIGIIAGLVGGNFYNRYATIALPEYLAFFGGRRFVPIAAGVGGLGLAAVIGLGFGQISAGLDAVSRGIVDAGGTGLFIYGLLNRLLLVTGLHHILNNVAWFVVGDYQGATGDIRRFFAGDPTAGMFMSGFFPVMMFGLPAACLAMYHEASPERRNAVGGLLFSLALTSFLTGVTEPIEFSFIFLAPLLYALHAVLTGLSMVVMDAFGVKLGFGFSAGLFDYVLNYGLSTRPLLLLPIGAAYALLYYGLFRFTIRRFNLPTPGRERAEAIATAHAPTAHSTRGAAFLDALGGAGNLTKVEACTTRLRLMVEQQELVKEPALRALGARGLIRPSAHAVQVVLGPMADLVAGEIREAMESGTAAPPSREQDFVRPDRAQDRMDDAALGCLGGPANIVSSTRLHGRWRVEVKDMGDVDLNAVERLYARGAANVHGTTLHIIVD